MCIYEISLYICCIKHLVYFNAEMQHFNANYLKWTCLVEISSAKNLKSSPFFLLFKLDIIFSFSVLIVLRHGEFVQSEKILLVGIHILSSTCLVTEHCQTKWQNWFKFSGKCCSTHLEVHYNHAGGWVLSKYYF